MNDGGVEFWRPPPLEYGPQSRQVGRLKKKNKTSWTLFVEKDYHFVFLNSSSVGHPKTVMVLQSKYSEEFYDEDDYTPVEQRTYFDHLKARHLIFQSPLSLPSTLYYNISIYGFPLLELGYYFLGNEKPQSYPASYWAYNNPHPDPTSEEPIGSQPSVEACRPTSLGVSGETITETVDSQLSSTSEEQSLSRVLSPNTKKEMNLVSCELPANKMDVDGPTLMQVTTEILQMLFLLDTDTLSSPTSPKRFPLSYRSICCLRLPIHHNQLSLQISILPSLPTPWGNLSPNQ